MKVDDEVKIMKIDKYVNPKCLGKKGIIENILTCEDGKKIYDVQIKNRGLVSFLEDQIMLVK